MRICVDRTRTGDTIQAHNISLEAYEVGQAMSHWEDLCRNKRWGDIDWMNLSRSEQAEFLEILKKIVPVQTCEDGIETEHRYLRPPEISDAQLKAAAEILMHGELEMAVLGGPPSPVEDWGDLRYEVSQSLRKILKDAKLEDSAERLSERWHAEQGLEFFECLDATTHRAIGLTPEDERAWLNEMIAEVAIQMFNAGRHYQSATQKPYDKFIATGQKVTDAGKKGTAARKGKVSETTRNILSEMRSYIEAGRNVSEAAGIAYRKGRLGTSPEANMKLWHRHKNRTP